MVEQQVHQYANHFTIFPGKNNTIQHSHPKSGFPSPITRGRGFKYFFILFVIIPLEHKIIEFNIFFGKKAGK
jgi:hypothetical protein